MIRSAFVALVGVFVFSACDTADNTPDPIPLNVQTATDIPADPAVAIGPRGPVGLGLFALYDLDTGQIVLGSDEVDPATRAADSTGTAWDIGFRTTTIIFNGGTSGTGSVQAQLLDNTIFAELTEAPANGYIQDGQNTCPAVQTPGGTFPGTPYVICTGSDNGWYNYNAPTNIISPLAGKTIVLQTSEGNYAKIRILSYYQGNPATPGGTGRYYTFEYILQPDGSRDFTETTPES